MKRTPRRDQPGDAGGCQRVRRSALVLVSLPLTDPLRAAADQHARTCAGCAAALDEASALLRVVDDALRPAQSAPGLHAALEAELVQRLSRARRTGALWAALLPALFAALVVATSRHTHGSGSEWLAFAGLLAVSCALAARALLGRGGLGSAVMTVLVAGAYAISGASHQDPTLGKLACGGTIAAAALLPVVLGRWVLPRLDASLSWQATLALTAASGLSGVAVVAVTCPTRQLLPHLMVFHVLALLLSLPLSLGLRALLWLPATARSRA